MLPKNDGPLAVPFAWPQGTRPGDPARSRRPVPAEGLQSSVAGLVVAVVACTPQIAGTAGRLLSAYPFGVSAVRASRMQQPIDRRQ